MCDSFVALPSATANGSMIFGKSADCQVNEAHALVRFPRKKYIAGAAVRATHRVIPQAAETHEVILSKSFWTWGAEIGINEYGVSIGNEAVYTTLQKDEKSEGLMVIDMLRIGLERGKTSREAVEAIAAVLEEFGQGGNCELAGNSHFDGSYLIVDPKEAWVLETAGRQWVAKRVVDGVGSISNVLSIGADWELASLKERLHWANTYGDQEILPKLGSRERQACSYDGLAAHKGNITVRTFFNVLRQHPEGYHPANGEFQTNICVHAGAADTRQWQATGAMVTEVTKGGDKIAWCTGTSGTCTSIFKPVFLGIELPEIGPLPTEQEVPQALWWKHEQLHRRAMADFEQVIPALRHDFDALEDEFLAAAESVIKGTAKEKQDLMEYSFHKAEQCTEEWTRRLSARKDLTFNDAGYAAMWDKYNRQAGVLVT